MSLRTELEDYVGEIRWLINDLQSEYRNVEAQRVETIEQRLSTLLARYDDENKLGE